MWQLKKLCTSKESAGQNVFELSKDHCHADFCLNTNAVCLNFLSGLSVIFSDLLFVGFVAQKPTNLPKISLFHLWQKKNKSTSGWRKTCLKFCWAPQVLYDLDTSRCSLLTYECLATRKKLICCSAFAKHHFLSRETWILKGRACLSCSAFFLLSWIFFSRLHESMSSEDITIAASTFCHRICFC